MLHNYDVTSTTKVSLATQPSWDEEKAMDWFHRCVLVSVSGQAIAVC